MTRGLAEKIDFETWLENRLLDVQFRLDQGLQRISKCERRIEMFEEFVHNELMKFQELLSDRAMRKCVRKITEDEFDEYHERMDEQEGTITEVQEKVRELAAIVTEIKDTTLIALQQQVKTNAESIKALEGDPVSTSLSSDDISRLRSLCREMGVDESKFLPSSESESSSQVSKAEFLQLAARNSRLEVHIEELSARMRKLELALCDSNSSPILQRVQTLEQRQNDFDFLRLETRTKPENTTPVDTDDLKKEIQELKTREDRVESEIARLHDESYVLDFCGTMLYRGWGFSQNRTEAARFFKMSADRCNSSGRAHYGISFYYGHGVERDFAQSAKYFKLSAAQGNCEGQDMLADSYFHGRGVTKDWNKAYEYHKLAADQGHAGGYWACGCHYYHAHAVPRDYVKAAHFFKIAADMGHAGAQDMYGWMTYNGEGIKCDYDAAAHYFQLGADQGHVSCQSSLGYCFFAGRGVPQDFIKAAHYFKLSADEGSSSSQFYYGHCLEEGKGVEKNMTEAIRYYKLAADQGNKSAQARLEKLKVTTPK